MLSKIDLSEIQRRANYAAYQDGLAEIFMGVFLLFIAGAMESKTTIIPFAVITVFFAKPLLERIKKQVIYPRAGYVRLPQDKEADTKGIVIGTVGYVVFLLAAMGISIGVKGSDVGLTFFMTYILPPSTGFMLAMGPYYLGETYGIKRGYLFAALFLLGGIAMPVFDIAVGYNAVALLCLVVGLIILITGITLFTRFIRKYAPEPMVIGGTSNDG